MTTEKRLPKTGDVYCEISGTHWMALQIVEVCDVNDVVVFLDLDWYSERKMTSEDLETALPLKINRFRMENELSISTVSFDHILQTELPPNEYHYIGNKPLLEGMIVEASSFQAVVTWQNDSVEEYGSLSDWPHSGAAMEAWWSEFPESDRNNFKKCYQLNQDISLLGQELNSRDSDIFIPDNAVQDWNILDDLGCLTSIKCEGKQDGLIEYLKTRSLIEHVNWKNCVLEKIDLRVPRVNWLHTVSVGGPKVEEIILDSGITSLHLDEKLNTDLKIIHDAKGNGLNITLSNNLVDGQVPDFDLPKLKGLTIYSTVIDALGIVQAYPNLEEIDLRGELGIIKNMDALGELKQLKRIMLFDLFGYSADEFPDRSKWGNLESIYIQTYPAELTKKLKKEFSDCKEYSVRMPKKPEWIAENLDNPFRDWEGREIATSKIKKAFSAYKKANAEIRAPKKPIEKTKLISALKEFTESMNKISGAIDTIEREELFDIYLGFLKKAGKLEEKDEYLNLFDQWRDF